MYASIHTLFIGIPVLSAAGSRASARVLSMFAPSREPISAPTVFRLVLSMPIPLQTQFSPFACACTQIWAC